MPQSTSSVLRVALRRWLLAVILLAGPLLVVIVTFYLQDRAHERELVKQRVSDTLELAAEKVERELQSVESDVLFLAQQSVLRDFVQEVAGARDALQQEYLTFAREKAIFDQIRLLNLEGDEVIRINYQDGKPEVVPDNELQPKSTRYYFQQAVNLEQGEVFVSPMDLNEEHGAIQLPYKPVIRFVTPVYSSAGARSGYLVLNYLGQNVLNEFAETTRGLPGQNYVANAQGEFLDSPNPRDNWGWLLGHDESLGKRFPQAWPPPGWPRPQTQLAQDEGVFSIVRLPLGAADPAEQIQQSDERDQRQVTDPSLSLVSFVSWPEIDSRSELLLQRLAATAAGALALLAVLAGYWAHSSAMRVQQRNQLAESESRLRVLSRQLLHAQEEERRRISRDLHDDLSQQITAISLNLQSAGLQKTQQDSQALIAKGVDGAQQLLASLHRIAGNLRPSVLDDLDFVSAIESLAQDLESVHDIKIDCRLSGLEELELPGDVKENAYRIVQEGLANAARHAECDEVQLSIEQLDGSLNIMIADQGRGFVVEEADSSRLGLLGMRERAELLGGEFRLQSQPGSGTTIEASLPVAEREHSNTD